MPSAPPSIAARRTDDVHGSQELAARADDLLTVMASIRRSGRLLAGRPVELSTLTSSQIELVRLILRRPGLSVTQAAEELRLAPNTVSTLIRQLNQEGLLIRRIDEEDRRVAHLDLTPTMRRKVGAFRDRRVAMLVGAMTQMSARDRRRLADSIEILEQLARRLEEQESASA